jgi:hypothetical protein
MEQFFLSAKTIHSILKEKEVEYLFHANTVQTAMTFIRERALLSRGYIEVNNLTQTAQKSDVEDVKFGVWDDVFLDGLDLHTKYKQPNYYGPVLFRMKLDLLLSPSFPNVLVTKSNPMYWKDDTLLENKYYSDAEQIRTDYLTGKKLDSQIMFTLRSPNKLIKFNKFLDAIGIDKPNIIVNLRSGGQKNVGEYAYDKIVTTLKENGLGQIPVLYRHEKGLNLCRCAIKYTWLANTNKDEFEKRFKGQ